MLKLKVPKDKSMEDMWTKVQFSHEFWKSHAILFL
jgi:hypothetical protein